MLQAAHALLVTGRSQSKSTSITLTMLYSAAMLLFFTPAVYALPTTLFRLWQVATCAVGAIATLLYLGKCKMSPGWLAFCLFFVFYYFYSSVAMGSDGWMVSIIYNTVRGIGFISLVYYGLARSKRELLLGFIIGGSVMCAINYATFIKYRRSPSGMIPGGAIQNWYFLGHDNMSLFYYLPVVATMLAYGKRYRSKVLYAGYACLGLVLFMYIYLHSAAALGSSFVFTLLLAAFVYMGKSSPKRSWRFFSPRQVVVIGIVLAFFVVAMSTSGIVSAIATQFDKVYTFRLRQIIWMHATEAFQQNPLFGVGFNAEATRVQMLTYDHAHNSFMQIIFQGGVVGLVLYFAMGFLNAGGSLIHLQRGNLSYHVLTACMFALALAGCVDFYPDILPQYFPIVLTLFLGGNNDNE